MWLLFLLLPAYVCAQQLKGIVLEETKFGNFAPINGATVYWLNTSVATQTDSVGVFIIPFHHLSNKLIVSYIGYMSDTLQVENDEDMKIVLANNETGNLQEVEVTSRNFASYQNMLDPLNTKIVTEKELFKAACCNLSESFETNPSVDVSYTDAVTGARQIQTLGLSGIYTQMLQENLPSLRGLASYYGLQYTPGTWVESIQVTKGVGSAAYGYESFAGQINVEHKKPDKKEKLLANIYINDMMRYEANTNVANKLSANWSTATMLHANTMMGKIDMNNDGFIDLPTGYQLNMMHRWKYTHMNGWIAQFGIAPMVDERIGGQSNFDLSNERNNLQPYGIGIFTKRAEGFGKAGYVFPQKKYKSIGLQMHAMYHDQHSFFGIRDYDAKQNSLYINMIYQSIVKHSQHKFKTGITYMTDGYDETLMRIAYRRAEHVIGAYMEYTYTPTDKFTFVQGTRLDYNNLYGLIFTPRLHIKYDITNNDIIRLSIGKASRTMNIFADNVAALVSSRSVIISTISNNYAYGLEQSNGWNYGVGYTKNFEILSHDGTISIDAYRTDFQNSVVTDMENPTQIRYYNMEGFGKTYAASVQSEVNYELLPGLDTRVAYRWLDTKTTYGGVLLTLPYVAAHRVFMNVSYITDNLWKFDFTVSWYSTKRLPNTMVNPAPYVREATSPSYTIMNAQVSKTWFKTLDVYIGSENLGDFRQETLISSSSAPYSPYFDASLVWGPVIGRMIYTGVRYRMLD
ncbi:MAG: carboxypeptidase-like regulatory domain-containing protein [Cytophagales bacterium]|nr:carboxypeptidase-like regulatory domain-containing protein [Cytophagales bacterium]